MLKKAGIVYTGLLIFFLAALNSCIGVSMDISMRQDGSGKIALEYRFSAMAESLGRLDGNEQWPVIPVGRSDFERTVTRIPGLKLVSFSSREEATGDGRDMVNKAELEFKDADALLAFLDPSGRRASIGRQGNSHELTIAVRDPDSSEVNPDLVNLLRQVCAGYQLNVSFSADGNSTLLLKDSNNAPFQPPAGTSIVPSGKKVSLSMGTASVLEIKQGLKVNITW